MRRMLKTVAMVVLCGLLMAPAVEARGRQNGSGNSGTHQSANQGGSRGNSSSSRPTTSRPGNNGAGTSSRPNNNTRPGSSVNTRPGNNNNRPGGNDRPNNKPPQSYNPGHNSGYNPGHNPGYHQGGKPNHHGPVRPHMPPPRPFHRPVPPPAWSPAPGWTPFQTMLGVAIGSAFSNTLNALIYNGYSVNSYGDNVIYLSNVDMMNARWPDAMMYFDDYGRLYASSYVYSSTGYGMSRYDFVYTQLSRRYGMPVSTQNLNNGIETVWWGANNQFIRLSYIAEYAYNGTMRYYTTLSYGNYQ